MESTEELKFPCNICLDEKCGGKHNYKCSTCKLKAECNRHLHAVIRITNKCTQECIHCCYSSSPKSKRVMSVEQSKKTAQFLKSNNVETVNILGGEFFCNPDWFEVMSNIVGAVRVARIVTNGDWANSMLVKTKLSEFISLYGNKIVFAVSKDVWHTNKYVEEAEEFLKEKEAKYHVATEEETTTNSIVPVGRAQLHCIWGIYSMVGCYCQNPKEYYSFLIDEEGAIYKCGFGVLRYVVIDNYVDGGFAKRFKTFNTLFYSKFIPSCRTCYDFMRMNNTSNDIGHELLVKE